MTTRKQFKRLVRDRMARTGERYTVARAHLASRAPAAGDWELRGGAHADTAAFANVLANTGVLAPHTGEPLTEAMVLGVGGGLGRRLHPVGVRRARRERIVVLGFRRQWQYPGRWVRGDRGAPRGSTPTSTRPGAPPARRARLAEDLDRGLPADRVGRRRTCSGTGTCRPGSTGTAAGRSCFTGARAIACSSTTGPRAGCRCRRDRIAAARARVGSYRHRLDDDRPGAGRARRRSAAGGGRAGPRAAGRAPALAARTRSACLHGASGRGCSAGAARRRGPSCSRTGAGSGARRPRRTRAPAEGARLRALYAEFLDDAATLVERPALRGAASAWRSAAGAWERVADVALEPGDELRELIDASSAAIARRRRCP